MILCLQVIYFLFVFCVNLVLPLLPCVIFPTILNNISDDGRNKWCFSVKDVESWVGEIGSLWWNQFLLMERQYEILTYCTETFLCLGLEFDVFFYCEWWRHWWNKGTKKEIGGRWIDMQRTHSRYFFGSSLWSLHINELTEGDLEYFGGKIQN